MHAPKARRERRRMVSGTAMAADFAVEEWGDECEAGVDEAGGVWVGRMGSMVNGAVSVPVMFGVVEGMSVVGMVEDRVAGQEVSKDEG